MHRISFQNVVGHGDSLYIVEAGVLHEVNPASGKYEPLNGGRNTNVHWRASPVAITSLGNSLFILENGTLHAVDPASGTWTTLLAGRDAEHRNWSVQPIAMTALGNSLYIIENKRLHRVNPQTGSWTILDGGRENPENWKVLPIAMAALGDWLYIIENGHLHKVNPADGTWKILTANRSLDVHNWGVAPVAITATGDSLYIVENQTLHKVNPADGTWVQLKGHRREDGLNWRIPPVAMTNLQGSLFVLESSTLHKVSPDNGIYEILGRTGAWHQMQGNFAPVIQRMLTGDEEFKDDRDVMLQLLNDIRLMFGGPNKPFSNVSGETDPADWADRVVDALRATGVAIARPNSKEKEFFRDHRYDASVGFFMGVVATQTARFSHPQSLFQGRGDAMRHCFWAASMAATLGRNTAVEILANHELGQPFDEMDAHNNAKGIELGSDGNWSPFEIWKRCGELADAKELVILREQGEPRYPPEPRHPREPREPRDPPDPPDPRPDPPRPDPPRPDPPTPGPPDPPNPGPVALTSRI